MTDAKEIAILKDQIEELCRENAELKAEKESMRNCFNCANYIKKRKNCESCKNLSNWEIEK